MYDPKPIDQFSTLTDKEIEAEIVEKIEKTGEAPKKYEKEDFKSSLTENENELYIKKWAYSLRTFLDTIKQAYPKSYKFTDFENYLINEVIKPEQIENNEQKGEIRYSKLRGLKKR